MVHRLKNQDDDNAAQRSYIRAYGALRRAISRARGAIVVAKLRLLRRELICHAGASVDAYAKPVADAARWPQAPLILGDKWDF